MYEITQELLRALCQNIRASLVESNDPEQHVLQHKQNDINHSVDFFLMLLTLH